MDLVIWTAARSLEKNNKPSVLAQIGRNFDICCQQEAAVLLEEAIHEVIQDWVVGKALAEVAR